MRKRNRLYTINKWNHPLVQHGNTFDDGGNLLQWDRLASQSYGANYGEEGSTLNDYMNSKNSFGISKQDNPFSKGNIGATAQTVGGTALSTPIADKALDDLDPVYHLAGGRESAVGNGLSDAGKSIFKASAQSGNGWGMLAGAGLKIVGGLTNAAFGIKTNKQALQNANNAIDYYSNFKSNAQSFDDITGIKNMGSFQSPYKGGWFTGGKARKKNEKLKNQFLTAESWANRSVDNNIDNISNTQMNTLLANYSALGGLLNASPNSSGAIDYGFMSDYLATKNKSARAKDKVSTNIFGNLSAAPFGVFALGGDIQTNGSDFTTGLSEINAGGSHEENPYQGVQVGISRENGQPNLVEEGETIFDDYVFSRRIHVDNKTKKRFHIGKKAKISYADLSKKIEKESLERPNDPISQKGLTKQLHELAEEQERQKSEEQTKEVQDLFNRLPPEQQQAIMQQIAMQEQQMLQEQQNEQAQKESMPQDNQQMMNEQVQQQQPQIEAPMQEGEQMNACGGRLNRFDKGGEIKKKIYKYLSPFTDNGIYTDSDFDRWATANKIDKIIDWENILQNKQFVDALRSTNPSLADVIGRGYDFGVYTPSTTDNRLTFDFLNGGWGKEDYDAWNGSNDAAWQEAVKKGLVKKGMNSEEIGKALMQTEAYKRGTVWLRSDENNRLKYLQAIYNSADAPEAARAYAGKYVDKNGWLKDVKRDYQTIFEDPNGLGVRNTHPGTYWKTPNEILRERQAKNLVINKDGSVEEIFGEVPNDWSNTGSYTWADANNDYAYNYYKRPEVKSSSNALSEEEQTSPRHKATWGRYAGLAGPLVGLGLQAAGVGKPNYAKMDAALDVMNDAPTLASYKPMSNYLSYTPMDIWYEQNKMDANSRATDRAILNNSSPIGTKMAGLLANGYNSQIANGELYRKSLEYNDTQRQKAAEFNRGTDMFNSEAFSKASATNAEIQNRNRQIRAQMAMEAANQRMAADAAWNQGIYGNVAGLFKGLGDWGTENARHNMIADMAADGIFGTIGDSQNIARNYITKRGRKASKGGKLNRRKGLTF